MITTKHLTYNIGSAILKPKYLVNSLRSKPLTTQHHYLRTTTSPISTQCTTTFLRPVLRPANRVFTQRNSSPVQLSFRPIHGHHQTRKFSVAANDLQTRNNRVLIYILAVVIAGVGVSYAAVPLYKIFCQAYGFGGTTQQTTASKAATMMPVPGSEPIRVTFSGTVADTLGWKFKPQQREVKVVPGETALAFYTAYNPTDTPVTGVATYNVQPAKAGIYFNKIQCFCFDEQRLKPKEEVDMPIFFFIDPEFANDPQMKGVNDICLSYVFFKAKDQEDE